MTAGTPLAGGRAFQAAELCLGQGFVGYGAYAKREQLVGNDRGPPLPRAGPSRPRSSASNRVLRNTVLTQKGNNLLGMTAGPLAGGRAFQAAELCLGQGFVGYGTYAKREQLVGNVFGADKKAGRKILPARPIIRTILLKTATSRTLPPPARNTHSWRPNSSPYKTAI